MNAVPQRKALDLEAEIERLHHSIDDLTSAVSGLKNDMGRQADQMKELGDRQSSDFRELLGKQHESYKDLLKTQTDAFSGFGDRLDKLVEQQHQQAVAIRGEMRTDFSRIVDRQDSQFRWLIGLALPSAIALAGLLFKAIHP